MPLAGIIRTRPAASTGRPYAEEEMNMWWNLCVFALIGAFAGAAARVFYAGRQPMKILGTVVLGMVGALLGGLISWTIWPAVADDIHTGALVLSWFGGLLALAAWPTWVYFRSISTPA
jgi:uncharacterized membrane protein YeaQ/YmgE (transglycosylase-associated protein family)